MSNDTDRPAPAVLKNTRKSLERTRRTRTLLWQHLHLMNPCCLHLASLTTSGGAAGTLQTDRATGRRAMLPRS